MRVRVGATTKVRTRSKTVTTTFTRERVDRATAAQNGAVVAACAEALGRLGDPAALWPLMDLVEERDEAGLGAAAAWAVGAIGTEAAGVFLADLARDGEVHRRAWAAGGLAALEGPGAVAPLWALAEDPDDAVRRAARLGLGGREYGETAQEIERRLLDPSPALRETALDVLERHAAAGRVTEEQVALLRERASGDSASGDDRAVRERVDAVLARLRRPPERTPRPPAPSVAAGNAAPGHSNPSLASEVTPEGILIFLPVRHRILETAGAGAPAGGR